MRKGKIKTAKNRQEAYAIEEQYKGKPHGWIVFKDSFIEMQVYCKCGHISIVKGDMIYMVKCPKCLTTFCVNAHIEFIELTEPVE